MARRQGSVRRVLRAVGLVLLVALALVGLRTLLHDVRGPRVAVVELHGVISDAADEIELLDDYRTDPGTVAVVLRVDSPGGAVAPSQELYDAVTAVRKEKPVVASLGNVAASGGYYVASAANRIVADPGTLTGSIGAIMSLASWGPLAEKIGVGENVVKSGRYKDIGHPLRPMTDDERALLQGMVDDILGQFVDAVAKGRAMDPARVREIADGRLFSGAQAEGAGLVDELGGLQRAIEVAWALGGQTGAPRSRRIRRHQWPRWLRFVTDSLDRAELGGGLMFLYGGARP